MHNYPCRCLCFGFGQITRTTPWRRTILHLSQILFTDARTFIDVTSLQNLLDDSSPAHVGPRDLHANPIAHQDTDEIPVEPIRNVRNDRPAGLIETDTIERARQHLDNRADNVRRYLRTAGA